MEGKSAPFGGCNTSEGSNRIRGVWIEVMMPLFKSFTRRGIKAVNTESQWHRYLPVGSGLRGLIVTFDSLP
jgi:hypothetical protein